MTPPAVRPDPTTPGEAAPDLTDPHRMPQGDDELGQPWTRLRWTVIDVEGNGQHPDPDLVEVAVVTILDGQVGPVRSWLIRPPRPITWRAQKVHGLSTADVAHAPTIAEVAPEILAALHDVDALVGHQVTVDLAVLRRSIPGWPNLPAVDTLRLARAWHADLPSHRLGALADHFHLTTALPGAAHRAGYDATVTARLLQRLATTPEPATIRQLLDVGRPPRETAGTTPTSTGPTSTGSAGADTLFEVP